MKSFPTRLALTLTAVAALGLAACDRADDGRLPSQKVEDAVARVQEKAAQAKDVVADKAADVTITASIKAELAKDDKLSALDIDVDTTDGHVALRGAAPDAAARERAARLAGSIAGVKSVDNQLKVENS